MPEHEVRTGKALHAVDGLKLASIAQIGIRFCLASCC